MPHIRTIAIGVAIRDDRILAIEGFDSIKGERFYRPPGGGIEFGETSEEGLRRELREELDIELAETRYLGTLESVFTYEGRPGHEIVFVHRVELADDERFLHDTVAGAESDGAAYTARWLPLDEVRTGAAILYPDGLLALLDGVRTFPDAKLEMPMTNDNAILVQLFRHNQWANRTMLDACRDLTAEDLSSEVIGTYGRLDRTLIHLARAQGGYLRTLADWRPGEEHRLEYDDPFPGVDHVAAHLRFTGERLIEVARVASIDRVVEGTWGDEAFRLPEWVLLLHAAHHATEHRQQIATMLTSLGLSPPEPDVVAYWNAVGEAGR